MRAHHNTLQIVLDSVFTALDGALEHHWTGPYVQETGTVRFVGHGIARVVGLPNVRAEELVRFPGNRLGLAFTLDLSGVGVILLDESEGIHAGAEVYRTGRILDVPVGDALLFYNRFQSGVTYRPHWLQLLPLDARWLRGLAQKPWPSRVLPLFTMNRDRLFSCLVRQYLFVALARAFAESLASENASRLTAMQGAERNIAERFDQLQTQFHQQRQMTITDELLDIVASFEALSEPQ